MAIREKIGTTFVSWESSLSTIHPAYPQINAMEAVEFLEMHSLTPITGHKSATGFWPDKM